MRNTKTPQGTETAVSSSSSAYLTTIEKYEDPAGDGNILLFMPASFLKIEKYEDPAGDGNLCVRLDVVKRLLIEKYEDPAGDGSSPSSG